jgi:hypothetical protein
MVTEPLPTVTPPKTEPGFLAAYFSPSLEIVVLVSGSRELIGQSSAMDDCR